MPQIEQNLYLNALNQAKSDIVHKINMPTIYPLAKWTPWDISSPC